MSILSVLLFLYLIPDGESTSNHRNTSVLPPPHFLGDHRSESIHDRFVNVDSVDHSGHLLLIDFDPDEIPPPSHLVNPHANAETDSDEALNQAVPSPPRSLRVTFNSYHTIYFAWSQPQNMGGSAITGYKVEWSTNGGTDWLTLDTITPTIAYIYVSSRLTPGNSFRFRVRAINSDGDSEPSNVLTVIAASSSGTGIPTNVIAKQTSANEVQVSWTAPTDLLSTESVTGYQLYRSTDSGDFWTFLASAQSTSLRYTDQSLTSGTTYGYRLLSITTSSQPVSSLSTPIFVTLAAAPDAPTALQAMEDGQTKINLSWTAPSNDGGASITGYRIEVSTNGGTDFSDLVASHSTTSYSHTGLTAGTTRHYRVSAINVAGPGATSNIATATTEAPTAITAPSAPTSLTAAADGQTIINLNWAVPSNNGGAAITGYKVEVSPDGTTNTWSDLERNTRSTAVAYSHTGLTARTTRYYRVSAINSEGPGTASNIATATTEAPTTITAPSAPTSLKATPDGETIINLSWTAPSNDGGATITGYRIEVSPNGTSNWTDEEDDTKSTTTTYSHTGLTAATTQYYRVSAINSVGTGKVSNVANATTDDEAVSLPALAFASTSFQVDEAIGTYLIPITLSASSNVEITIGYTLSGTATEGDDYTIQQSVTLSADSISTEIPIEILDDSDLEEDETVIVTLFSAAGYQLGSRTRFTLTITDNDALTITDSVMDQSYFVGLAIEDLALPIASGGTPPLDYMLTPELPNGLRFDVSTRVLSGTPTAAVARKTFTYRVTDAIGITVSKEFTIAVVQPKTFTFTETIDDQAYPIEIPLDDLVLPVAMGGITPYSYTLTPDLPAGLTFDPDTRTLSGTPTAIATAETFTYTAEDRADIRTSLEFRLAVYQMSFTEVIPNQVYPRAQPIDELSLPEAMGGVSPIQYTVTPNSLPVGLRFDPDTRTLGGTPTEVTPPVRLTYSATDANRARDSLMFTIEVVSPIHTETETGLPQAFQVYPNYPNPFDHSTHLVFDLPWPAQVQVEVLDVMGRRVDARPAVSLSAGWSHEVELSDLNLPAGPYLYRIQATSIEDHSTSVYTGQFMRVR